MQRLPQIPHNSAAVLKTEKETGAQDTPIAQLATWNDLNYNLQRGDRREENCSAIRAFNSYLQLTNLLYWGPQSQPEKKSNEASF